MSMQQLNYFKKFFTEDPVNFILMKREQDEDDYLNRIDKYVAENKKSITSSQLRNIFSKIKRLGESDEDVKKLKRLRVNLAYIAGRSEKKGMQNLCALLDELIQQTNKNNIQIFKDFFEAIIAYHKYHNPKGN